MNQDPICPDPLHAQTSRKYNALVELLESAITDFAKLKPFIGEAAEATASMYRDELAQVLEEVASCIIGKPDDATYHQMMQRAEALRASAAEAGKGEPQFTEKVDELQRITNASRHACFCAVAETGGNMEDAVNVIRNKGNATSAQSAADRSQDARDEQAFWAWWRSYEADEFKSGIWSAVEKARMAWRAAKAQP